MEVVFTITKSNHIGSFRSMYLGKILADFEENRLDIFLIIYVWVSFASEYFLCIIHIDKKAMHVSKFNI